jgi:hypothetical protein
MSFGITESGQIAPRSDSPVFVTLMMTLRGWCQRGQRQDVLALTAAALYPGEDLVGAESLEGGARVLRFHRRRVPSGGDRA